MSPPELRRRQAIPVDADRDRFTLLHPAERATEATAPFCTVWTRKEAVVEALGDGLDRSPRDAIVAAPDEPPRLVSLAGRSSPPPFFLHDLTIDADYAGAVGVATDGPLAVSIIDASDLLHHRGRGARR